ncbi:MAG TPA: MauE/DoxX family redox-associated membrane protein [Acidimicrobiales bacterium]|nr:MauE/DoxX family redox-associated membrane protein [Acidimicrobiales bacterium]
MNALGGPAIASAILLAIGGASKVMRPANTSHALRGLGLPAAPVGVRLLAIAEIGVAVGALAWGGRYAWMLVGGAYLGFAGFVVLAMSRGGAVSSCGCFGAPDTPPTLVHVLVTVSASALAFATAAGHPPGPLLGALADMPLLGLPFLLVTGCCVWFAYAAVAVLPKTARLR